MAVFSNRATLAYNGTTTDSNIAYGEILDALAVTKTALQTSYQSDAPVTYVVSMRNTGTTALTGLTLTDDLGGYTFGNGTVYPLTAQADDLQLLINGVLQTSVAVTAGPPLTITGLNIPAGGDAVLIYQVRTNEFANPADGGSITNTVTLSGSSLAAPVTADATLDVVTTPALAMTKSISPSQVTDNDRVTYTFVISNTGSAPLVTTDNATITDTFDPILTDLTVTFNGVQWTEGTNYTYNPATGLFSTNPGQLSVEAAGITQDATTGAYTVTPGISTLTITGTI